MKKMKSEPEVAKKEPPQLAYHIDTKCFCGDLLVIVGWVADESALNINLPITGRASQNMVIFRGNRTDVSEALHGDGKKHAYAFVALTSVDRTRELNAAVLQCGDLLLGIEMTGIKDESFEVLQAYLVEIDAEDLVPQLALLIDGHPKVFCKLVDFLPDPKPSIKSKVLFFIENQLALTQGVYLYGWLCDEKSLVKSIYVRQRNRLSKNIYGCMGGFPRPDVVAAYPNVKMHATPGFYAYAEIDGFVPGQKTDLIILLKSGAIIKHPLEHPSVISSPVAMTQQILNNFDPSKKQALTLADKTVDPALQQVWATGGEPEVEVINFGAQASKPKVSLIIPIYGRFDFVMYQMASFVADDFLREQEIIYVLDDPSIEADFKKHCAYVAEVFNVPFKAVLYDTNLGYAKANNLGVKCSTAPHVLLMNSDVLPSKPGWLEQLLKTYNSKKDIGALGVKLLFEDGTIQHNGMSVELNSQYPGIYLNKHPGKGLPEYLCANTEGVAEIALVTAACMMVSRSNFVAVGGFSENYILGDFEDSDLCFKLQETGCKNMIQRDISLFHLERQSQSMVETGAWKHKLTLYNGWQHSKRWGKQLEALHAGENV